MMGVLRAGRRRKPKPSYHLCIGCGKRARRFLHGCVLCHTPLHARCKHVHERTCHWQGGFTTGKEAGRNEVKVEIARALELAVSPESLVTALTAIAAPTVGRRVA